MEGGALRRCLRSIAMLVPPVTERDARCGRWNVRSSSHSFLIWKLSSRVGAMMSAPTDRLAAAGSLARARTSTSTDGSRKPVVLPVPVLALAMTSRPCSTTGNVASCTAVRHSYRRISVMPRIVSGDTGSWSKRVADRCFVCVPVGAGRATGAATTAGAGGGAPGWTGAGTAGIMESTATPSAPPPPPPPRVWPAGRPGAAIRLPSLQRGRASCHP
mmetsp:Transcript_5566/g.17564  ORF Transcript_5566/g.17564 Transcript_5566/m.17564 type:complete len:216 (+) Transcript_5566:1765-2412(+)